MGGGSILLCSMSFQKTRYNNKNINHLEEKRGKEKSDGIATTT
jgi:hypothetical protein